MARFTNPSTWGRSKPKASAAELSTADLNQSSSYRDPYAQPSSYGAAGGSASGSGSHHHPYASNPSSAPPVIAHDVTDSDETCPVCLESLAFSFRLPGEKPHVVPECGHALHEACFTTVYGPLPTANRAGGAPRKSNIGVCGVCRRPMKVGDGDGGKSNKLAALTGMDGPEDSHRASPFPGSPMPSVIVGPNRLPGASTTAVATRLGHTPMASSVVVLGGGVGGGYGNQGQGGHSPSPSTATGPQNKASNALIDAHPSGGSYAATPVMSANMAKPFDPNEDDPLEHSHSIRSGSSGDANSSHYVIAPSIQVRSEFPTITPGAAGGGSASGSTTPGGTVSAAEGGRMQPLTCIVIVELASRRTGPLPGQHSPSVSEAYMIGNGNGAANGGPNGQGGHAYGNQNGGMRPLPEEEEFNQQTVTTRTGRPTPPSRQGTMMSEMEHHPAHHHQHTPHLHHHAHHPSDSIASPAGTITTQTESMIKGSGGSGSTPSASTKQTPVMRDMDVPNPAFAEAIICVLEDKKKNTSALNRLLQSSNGAASPVPGQNSETASLASNATANKPVLRLKGRIYIRHIRRVHDTSTPSELSLTIDMEDERLESFILIFRDRTTLEGWRAIIAALVDQLRGAPGDPNAIGRVKSRERLGNGGLAANAVNGGRRSPGPPPPAPSHQQAALLNEMEEFGASPAQSKHRVTSSSTATSAQSNYTEEERFAGNRATMSSAATSASKVPSTSSYYAKNAISEYGVNGMQNGYGGQGHYSQHMRDVHSPTPTPGPATPTPMPHTSTATPSNSLPPLPHTSMDLILVISLPPPNSAPSTAALKLRVIKNALDFIIGSLGTRDRLSLVTFEVGVGGKIRKTPFLRIGRGMGRERLGRFVDQIAFSGPRRIVEEDEGDDDERNGGAHGDEEFLVRTGKDEKTDVVTGVNNALDTVLQRKAKNPISGMLLVSDASDSTRRAHMDLVLARAEAAKVPIHSFGWGRSHDPASLWLMSNHTSGTYTFVKDWYDLRPCLAGCIGGMMSIGLTSMKIHMKILDGGRFRIRKVSGGPDAVVSSDGRDVDVDVGELRYGEKKEMLVELELDYWGAGGRSQHAITDGRDMRHANATDQFVARMGLDALTIGDASPNLVDGMMDRMIDEVPVFEVDGSYFDPAVSKHVSRLAHPILLTVTILPPPASSRPASPNTEKPSDPVIVRRRMELLASDMITRALVLFSRKNYEQALKIMSETRRILNTVLQTIGSNLSGLNASTTRSRKELLTLSAIRALQAVLQDIQILTDAMDDNPELFAHDHRNLGAQQGMILRYQKSWSGRTAIEKLFWTTDSSIDLVQRSNDWVSIRD
ncbi:hypothetical protein FS837_012403 [Tulasnella sp. UAMH 9824]|nr:hypothetical protein FS837_012403 [Tulasnella sp. UAMH 9824]